MLTRLMSWFRAVKRRLFARPSNPVLAASEPSVAPVIYASPVLAPSYQGSATEAQVIEFHVPATFQLPARRWLPPEARGKVIEFPLAG